MGDPSTDENGDNPVLELAVVVVWNQQVSDAIHALLPQLGAVQIEVGEIGFPKTLDKVFFDAARRGHDCRDMLVLDEVEDDFAEAGGDEVGGVAKEDLASGIGADGRIEELVWLIFGGRFV